MTLLDALKKSRAMWLWLYENPGRIKPDYLIEIVVEPLGIKYQCFICDYHIKGSKCRGDCPINWGDNEPYACEETLDSPYYLWTEAESGSAEEHDAAGKIIDLHDAAIKECESC